MNGGKISGNTADSQGGGGVCVYGSSGIGGFIMTGGEISGNTAHYGGGVYVNSGGTFTKTGGVIYGSDASPAALKNTANNDDGHVAFVYTGAKIRNTTAGASINLHSNVDGSPGGWE
jgi:hypothetical protein